MNDYIFCTTEKKYKRRVRFEYFKYIFGLVFAHFFTFLTSVHYLKKLIKNNRENLEVMNKDSLGVYFSKSNNIYLNLRNRELYSIFKTIEHEDLHKGIEDCIRFVRNADWMINKVIR